MKFRTFCLPFCLAFLAITATASAEKPWLEVRSPHFRVLTDGSPTDARHVAYEFEQMRYVFATEFPRFRLESGARLTIFAARDEETAKELEPMMRRMKGAQLGGIFHRGWEKQYVMVRLDVPQQTRAIVYHEYTHSVFHLNAHWLPTWLDEGTAEFYGSTRFQWNKIYIGAPTARARVLQQETPIPVEDLMTASKVRSFYRDTDHANMFYAESWALVHYLTFGPHMGGGIKFNQFFVLIQEGKPQKQAFQQVFGPFATVDKGLDNYMRRASFQAAGIPDPKQIDEKTFTVKQLTMAQTNAELAGYHLWTHDLKDAQPLVTKALKDGPLGLALEEEGFLLFASGENGAAAAAFSQAYTLDGTLYLSLFARTMLSQAASLKTVTDQKEMNTELLKVLSIDSQFAPAYVQLARVALRQGDLKGAFGLSRRAEELEPWRAGYHLLTAQILLRMGKGAEAAGFAQYVAQNWQGPDHDEAVELWNRVPAAQRPAGITLTDQTPPGTQTIEGTVQSTQCSSEIPGPRKQPPAKLQPATLVLSHDGRPLTFRMNGPVSFGFSDTLWWGEDHASACRHLNGLRAVIHYRPSSDPAYAGDIAEMNIHDDLPQPDAIADKKTS